MNPIFLYTEDILCLLGQSKASDGAKVASDNIAGVPIAGTHGVLFLAGYGPVTDNETSTFQIQYASNGTASDAATSNAGMTCTDAVLLCCSTAVTATGSSNGGWVGGYFNISAKGFPDRGGKLYATRTASENPTALLAIPFPATSRLPSSNLSDVTNWTA